MSESAAKTSRLPRVLRSRIVWAAGGLLLLYTLCGFLLAPWLVRTQWPALVEKHLGAQGSLSEVRINPFLLTFEASGIAVAEKGKSPSLQVGRIFVDFEASSLLRWAWTFREIRIEQPVINAELDATESLNLARLLAPLIKNDNATATAGKDKEKSPPPRFLLQQLVIAGGAFAFTDLTLQPAARAQVNPLDFEIRDVSTLPDHRGEHRFEAKMPGGGSLHWQGTLSLTPLDTSGTIMLKGAKLATLWRFVQDHLTIAEPAGSYEAGLQYRLRYAEGVLQLHADDIAFRMKDVALAQQKDGSKLANVGSVALEGGSFDLQKRTLAFKDARVAGGAVNIILDEDSTPDWAKLVRSNQASAKPAASKDNALPEQVGPPWKISLPRVGVDAMSVTLVDYSRAKPLRMVVGTSQISLGAAASIGNQVQATVRDGAFKLQDIHVSAVDEQNPPVTLDTAELTGFALDLQKKAIYAELARLAGGRTWVRRNAEGELQLISMFAPRKVRVLKKLQQEGFTIAVDRAEISGYAVALTDQSFQPAIQYDLEQLSAVVAKITLPPKDANPFEFALRVKQGGAMKAKGAIDILKQSADVRFEATDLALAPLEPILKRETTLTLASGKASSAGRVTVNAKNEPVSLQYRGNASIADLDLRIENSTERLVSWKNIQVENIDFDTGKNRLTVAQVSLARPYSKLVVNKDRSTNLAAVLRPRPATEPVPAKPSAKPPMAISIERVSVERGEMDFADFSLVLPFATNVKSLNGTVNGLSSAQDSRASLKFEGRVEDYGLARAEGSVQAFNPKKFMDIAVIFRNVEMPALSPYSATFAGRKIDSGRISLDLKYKLDNSQLSGDNKILLERLKLGETVESPDAVNLPLDLAIALLTDSEGKIDLAVPVTGNVDSPEFSYGGVIWQALGTVISNIVSAPFRALGALFGANAETLGDIVFDPGSARILPTEYEKVRRIVDGLRKRPQLRLVVQGVYHAESDGRALRTQAVRNDLAVREGLKLKPGEDPGPVGFDSPKIQRALEIMLNERAGGDAAVQFATAFQKTAGRDAARVNPALALLNQGAGDRELYVAMHQKLIELQPLPPQALEELAKARAATITNGFTKRFEFDPARLASKPPIAVDALVNNGVPAKLSFEPVK